MIFDMDDMYDSDPKYVQNKVMQDESKSINSKQTCLSDLVCEGKPIWRK